MGPFDNSVGAVMFWLFVAAVSIAGTMTPYLRHRETQRTIRAGIDKGQPIDPALLVEPPKKDRSEIYVLFGAILLALGVGMQVLGVTVSLQAEETIYPIFGVGAMMGLVGLVLVVFGRWRMKTRGQ